MRTVPYPNFPDRRALPIAAVTALDSLRPRVHLEAMLAVQAIVCRHATMDCFRRAKEPHTP